MNLRGAMDAVQGSTGEPSPHPPARGPRSPSGALDDRMFAVHTQPRQVALIGGSAVSLRHWVLVASIIVLVAACGGGDDEQPSTAAPAATTAATTATTVTATTQAGTSYEFRGMTIVLAPSWKVAGGAQPNQAVEVADGRACIKSKLLPDQCPGFSLLGPELIATADEGQSPYKLDAPVHFASDVGPCPADPDHRYEGGYNPVAAPKFAKVGDHTAHYRVWRSTCIQADGQPPATGPAPTLTQRVWYLPRSQILVVDEWSTPGLPEALANARWN